MEPVASTTPSSPTSSFASATARRGIALHVRRAAGERRQRLGGHRARVGVGGDHDVVAERQQRGEHRGGVLVVEHAHDRHEPAAGEPLRQRRGERRDPVRVVGAVEEDRGVLRDDLEAPGHERRGGGLAHGRLVERPDERLGGGARRREVPALERALGAAAAPRRRAARAPAWRRAAPRCRWARASASGSRPDPTTSVAPASTTASFSPAISPTVEPSRRVWSSATFVSTSTSAVSTFVASSRPPRPASTTATSTPSSASARNAAAVRASNCVTRSSASASASSASASAFTRRARLREQRRRRCRRLRGGSAP